MATPTRPRGSLHHVELRVANLAATTPSWSWLLTELGYQQFQIWSDGASWKLANTYIVLERSRVSTSHDRRQPGLSHLAFHAQDRRDVDRLWDAAPGHGWLRLYSDRHPWAGGEAGANSLGHYAAFFENDERFKIEIVAGTPKKTRPSPEQLLNPGEARAAAPPPRPSSAISPALRVHYSDGNVSGPKPYNGSEFNDAELSGMF